MLRRSTPRAYWFFDQWNKESTENYHMKKPDISETYTKISQGLERITPDTPDSDLSPLELALKKSVVPISDALPVPRNVDPAYLSLNGEPVPQSYKFLPNDQLYEHILNSGLQWKMHPFENIISPHPSGYLEPLGPVKGNEDLPYTVLRTQIGKLPILMRYRQNYRYSAVQILQINGDKEAFAEDLRRLLPNKRVNIRADRVEIFKTSYDVVRLVQHYLFSLGF
eukprot:TRINITY_DN18060_c0_g1_i1.p1 TRINITY_DN18060_c0_g1~~TRINITY_DN18060_c0_g1_i1.p1  ORF type:complete len:250 (+),score=31.92 TRINITY_DN18060_c0_g1_i1:80-751(+)